MTDRPGFLPALVFLTAVAAPLVGAQAMPSAPAIAVSRPSALVLDVADARHPHRNVNRHVDRHVDRGGDTGDAEVERLNQMSLQRAQQGQNSPTPGSDTTSNLNNMSEQNAARGRDMGGQAPMPFR